MLSFIYKKFLYTNKEKEDKKVLSFFNDAKKILDVGCGVGRFIANDPNRIVGIDGNYKSVSICKNKKYDVIEGSVTDLPFKDSSFDAVHCSHVIEHLFPDDAHKMLREIDRVTKKDGLVCIRAPLMHKGFFNDFTHVKPYNPEAIIHYLKDNDDGQSTLDSIEGKYKIIYLKYRKSSLFPMRMSTSVFIKAMIVANRILYNLNIKSFRSTGYMILLKKIS